MIASLAELLQPQDRSKLRTLMRKTGFDEAGIQEASLNLIDRLGRQVTLTHPQQRKKELRILKHFPSYCHRVIYAFKTYFALWSSLHCGYTVETASSSLSLPDFYKR